MGLIILFFWYLLTIISYSFVLNSLFYGDGVFALVVFFVHLVVTIKLDAVKNSIGRQ